MRARLSTADRSTASNTPFTLASVSALITRSARWLIVLACLVALSAAPSAHHSVPGQFDTSKPTTLVGTVVNVDWVNPHVYVNLEVKTAGGVEVWKLGTAPPAMMRRAGLTKADIAGKPGEKLAIIIYPARDGTMHLGWITKITYADGHFYHLDAR